MIRHADTPDESTMTVGYCDARRGACVRWTRWAVGILFVALSTTLGTGWPMLITTRDAQASHVRESAIEQSANEKIQSARDSVLSAVQRDLATVKRQNTYLLIKAGYKPGDIPE